MGLTGIFQLGGKVVGNFDAFDGAMIIGGAPELVEAICRAARQNAKFRGTLLSLLQASVYSEIIMAASMIALPILMHHNLLPFAALFTNTNDNSEN